MTWSEQDLQLLRELYPTMQRREIAERLQRPVRSVRAKLAELKMKKRLQVLPWQPEELEVLRRLFPALGPHETAQALHRSVSAVKGMAVRLRLKMDLRPGELPVGTERLIDGRLHRKVSNNRGTLLNWRPVSKLEESPDLRELYRLLERIHQEAAAPSKRRPSSQCVTTC